MSTLERAAVTNWLLGLVSDNSMLITDVSAESKELPDVFGWSGDMASSESYFNPYIICIPQTGTVSVPTGLGGPSDWSLAYTMTVYGVDRTQVEDLADDLRNLLFGDHDAVLEMQNGSSWQVVYAEASSIGGVAYNGQVDPAFYSQTDSYVLRVSESL